MARAKEVTILVVDDEQVHRYMLCSMFKDWGWKCVEADLHFALGFCLVAVLKASLEQQSNRKIQGAGQQNHQAGDDQHSLICPASILPAPSPIQLLVSVLCSGPENSEAIKVNHEQKKQIRRTRFLY